MGLFFARLFRHREGLPIRRRQRLRRVWDFALVKGQHNIEGKIVDYALNRLEVDVKGLDRLDRNILRIIRDKYNGGPVGIDTLAVTLGEDRSTIEDVYEPYLIAKGYIIKGPRGRSLTSIGLNHLTTVVTV